MFDRVTGKPVWPIEEQPVEKGNVPGEWYSPTQPFPTKPPAYARNGVTVDDLIDFTPALRDQALTIIAKYKIGPVFTPPVESKLGRSAGDADARHRERRNQLAGRLVRSRNAHGLRVCVQRLPDADRPGDGAEGTFGHGVRGGHGRTGSAHDRAGPGENAGADSPAADARDRATPGRGGRGALPQAVAVAEAV